MKLVFRRIFWAGGLAWIAAGCAPSLPAAEIMGVIWDASGSVLPTAQVSLVNVHTGVLRRTTSNQSGYYSIPFLQPGSYRLTVRREGFMVATGGDVRLSVGQRFRVDVTMAVARVMETVQVEADGLLEDSSSGLGEVISEEAVSALPLNGRNFSQMLTLSTGATPVSTAQGSRAGPTDGYVTSGYGHRISPFTGREQFHAGLDIAAAFGTIVVAPARGRVVFSAMNGPFGRMIEIDHGYGLRTHFAHLSTAYVAQGQTVERGTPIAEVGSTGRSTGPHLHYGVEVNGRTVDPTDYIFE